MKKVLSFNKLLLFACTSMYFGTGWSLVLFSFPIAKDLTPNNYYMQFVPQVIAATHFFTYMTMVMIACCVIFIIEEWKSSKKWYPIIVLALVVLTTLLAIYFEIPYNKQMAAGIHDPQVLQEVLHNWMNVNILRVGLWTLQWLVMATYFFNIDLKTKIIYE